MPVDLDTKNKTRLIRVVHYPNEPHDFGVVARYTIKDKHHYWVFWYDGASDPIQVNTGCVILNETRFGIEKTDPVTTVSRDEDDLLRWWNIHLEAVRNIDRAASC